MASKKAFRWAAPLCAAAAALTLGAVARPRRRHRTTGGAATRSTAPDAPAVASPPAFPGRLYGVTAISASDVWAVGLGNGGTLELHFNGSKWTQYPGRDRERLLRRRRLDLGQQRLGGRRHQLVLPVADPRRPLERQLVEPVQHHPAAATSTPSRRRRASNAWAVGADRPGTGDRRADHPADRALERQALDRAGLQGRSPAAGCSASVSRDLGRQRVGGRPDRLGRPADPDRALERQGLGQDREPERDRQHRQQSCKASPPSRAITPGRSGTPPSAAPTRR